MPEYKVVSWNIQKFGEHSHFEAVDAHGAPYFVHVVALCILKTEADIIGIMEVVSNQGDRLVQLLANKLNELDPAVPAVGQGTYRWAGMSSERQSSGTQEQYIYLWKQGRVTPTSLDNRGKAYPSFQLAGILGDNDLDDLIYPLVNAQRTYEQLKSNLETQITGFSGIGSSISLIEPFSYNYKVNTWQLTDRSNTFPNLKPPFHVYNNDKNKLRRYLLANKPVFFPSLGYRAPYIGEFQLNNKTITIALFHAPGPQDLNRYTAINNISDVPRIRNAGNGLIMGDFNIDVVTDHNQLSNATITGFEYYIYQGRGWRRGEWVYDRGRRAFRVFQPITALGYRKSTDAKTSLKASRITESNGNPADISLALSSTYDKFFYKQGAAASRITSANNNASGNPITEVLPFVDYLNVGSRHQPSRFDRTLTNSIKFYFNYKAIRKQHKYNELVEEADDIRNRLGISNGLKPSKLGFSIGKLRPSKQKSFERRLRSIENRKNAISVQERTLLKVNDYPQNLNAARGFYRFAVSDHVPVRIKLNA